MSPHKDSGGTLKKTYKNPTQTRPVAPAPTVTKPVVGVVPCALLLQETYRVHSKTASH